MKEKLTIRELAKKLGVHHTTVSKALRNHPGVNEQTRKRIVEKAEAFGYRPNPLVSALMAHKHASSKSEALTTLPLVYPCNSDLQHHTLHETIQGIQNKAAKLGYSIERFDLESYGYSYKNLNRVFSARGYIGLFFVGMWNEYLPPKSFLENYACVCVGENNSTIQSVVSNHFQSTRLAYDEIKKMGHKRIGLIAQKTRDQFGCDTTIASFEFLMNHDSSIQSKIPVLLDPDKTNKEIPQWLENHKPDAVISSWRGDFPVLYEHLDPRRCFVLDSISADEAGVYQNRHFIGEKATDVLVGALHRNEKGPPAIPSITLIDAQWRSPKS